MRRRAFQHIIGPHAIETLPPGNDLERTMREIIGDMDIAIELDRDPRSSEIQQIISGESMSTSEQIWLRDVLIWL